MDEIFVERGDGELVAVQPRAYDSEDVLQALIEKYPSLLPGRQVGDEPRRWLLVSRELGVPREADGPDWYWLDHLFIDQDAIPTFVEVKRAADTRIRREVVGQMLDYAANATTYWQVDRLRTMAGPISDRLGIDHADVDAFWQKAEENLRGGRVRLVFLADDIPTELQRIIEYLNESMAGTEVYGVTVSMYAGDGVNVYVPKVVGQTARALDRKRPGNGRTFEDLLAGASPDFHRCLALIDEWARARGLEIGAAAKSRKIVRHGRSILWAYPADEMIQLAMPVLAAGPDGDDRRAPVAKVLATTFGARETSEYPTVAPSAILAAPAEFQAQVLDAFADHG